MLAAWLYDPGLDSPTLLDDAVNLSVLDELEDSPQYAADVVWGNRSGILGRSVSMFTFAMEKVYLDEGIWGLKRTNLLIHLIIGILVGLFCRVLAGEMNLSRPSWIGVGVAACWLLTPLHVSTVLYTVQRMAQLSMLFVTLAMLSYLQLRQRQMGDRVAWPFCVLVVLFGVLGVFSKENGALLLPLLLLVEWWIFRFRVANGAVSSLFRRVCFSVLGLGVFCVCLIMWLQPVLLMGGYEIRDFDMLERMLTQTRILWHYVGQLLLPEVRQMGVFHDDIVVSRSLSHPDTTFYAVTCWVGVVMVSVRLRQSAEFKGVGFGLLFFLVAHGMESSFLPLELYFEHRNYLASMGLFFAFLSALAALVHRWYLLRGVAISILAIFLLQSAYGLTYVSAQWSNRFLLHFGAVNAHPASARAHVELARIYAEEGHIQQAMQLSDLARSLEPAMALRHDLRDLLLHCLAGKDGTMHLVGLQADGYQLADAQTNDVLTRVSELIRNDNCPTIDAQEFADKIYDLVKIPGVGLGTRRIYSEMASLENQLGRLEKALEYTESVLLKAPMHHKGLLMKLYFASQLNNETARREALERLLELRDAGELSRLDEANLALFI